MTGENYTSDEISIKAKSFLNRNEPKEKQNEKKIGR